MILKSKTMAIITAAAFALSLFAVMAANIIRPKGEVSESERRKLAQYPALTVASVLDGGFMSKFETASLDQFSLREMWRSIKSFAVFNIFRQGDKGGIYVYDGSICKFGDTDEASIADAAQKFLKLRAQYLSDTNAYFALVPDKGYYAKGHPGYDYGYMRRIFSDMEGVEYIELADALSLSDYYRTDLHWDQVKLEKTVAALADAMDFDADLSGLHEEYLGDFAGAYLGQLALGQDKDGLRVLTGGFIDGVKATYLDEKTLVFKELPVYNAAALEGIDGYDAFLGGAKPVVILENANASTDRELIIFRDSFSSSLAPLLSGSFKKITLVDLRYIASPLIADYVDLAGATDTLFIYGPELLMTSSALLVK